MLRLAPMAVLAGGLLLGLAACSAETAEPVEDTAAVEEVMTEPTMEQPAAAEPVVAEPTEAEADEASAPEIGAVDGAMVFVVVPEQSAASYKAEEEFFSGAVERLGRALGFTEAVGRATGLGGELQISLEGQPQVVGGSLTVDLRGLTSDDERRDNRIRQEHLESSLFPNAEFVVTGAEGLPPTYTEGEEITFTLLGDLTVRETTKPVAWDVTATIADGTLTGTATTTINMSDFGIAPPNVANMMKVEDPLVLTAEIVAQAPS
jgi:polyisoprenoid-binding protein YceI